MRVAAGLLTSAVAALLATSPLAAAPAPQLNLAPVLASHGFDGFAMVANKDAILWQTPTAKCPPSVGSAIVLCHPRDPAFLRWPWASVTKQIMAVLTMQQVDAGLIALDSPASRYLPALSGSAPAPTIRQLLQHRAGLRNPEDSGKDASGTPTWYTATDDALGWCVQGRTEPGGSWRYNNCDTLVLGAVLEKVTGQSVATLFVENISSPLGLEATGFADRFEHANSPLPGMAMALTDAENALLARYGAAGGLVGPPLDLLTIDRALMAGKLLSATARGKMWQGDPGLGFMALGQWSFDAPLRGCAKPVHLIERRGGIGRFQVRNILVPDTGQSIIMFIANGDFDFGEIWQGQGLSHDVLSAAVCRPR